MRVPFGTWPWRPDQDALNAQVLVNVRNAIPTSTHWQPQKGVLPIATQVIPAPLQGLTTATRLDGTLEVFVVAAGAIYRIPSRTGALQGVSSGYYSYIAFDPLPTTRWRFLQFGDLLLGTDFADDIQAYDLTNGGLFVPLSAEAPRARYIAPVRDFPVVGYTYDSLNGEDAYQVRWPGFVDGVVDPTEWTLGNPETQADFQRVSDVGIITGLTGGQFGTIIGESGVAIMQLGGAATFTFEVRERRLGCRVPNSVVQYRQLTFWWSPEGVMSFDGTGVRPIGVEKVDRWLAADFQENDAHLMWTGVDNVRGDVLWLYPGAGHTGRANRLLRYRVPLDEFSVSDIEAEALGAGRTFGGDLDDEEQFPDIELIDNLDDPGLWESFPQTVLVKDQVLSGFTGAPLTGLFETASMQATPEARAILTKALVLHTGGSPSLRVGVGEQFSDGITFGTTHTKQSDGFLRFREPGRTHKLQVSLSGAWSKAEGIDIWAAPVGRR